MEPEQPIVSPPIPTIKFPWAMAALLIFFTISGILFFLTPHNSQKELAVTDTSSWKTYNNNQFGFSFKYPDGYIVSKENVVMEHKFVNNVDTYGYVGLSLNKSENGENFLLSFYRIRTDKSLNELSSEDEQDFNKDKLLVDSFKKIKIDGIDAVRIYNDDPTVDQDTVYFVKDNYVYNFDYFGSKTNSNDFDEIISTFKFISTSTPDTSGWKTYRNDEFGFEIKIPNNWIIQKQNPDKLEGDLVFISPETKASEDQNDKNCEISIIKNCVMEHYVGIAGEIIFYGKDSEDGKDQTNIVSADGIKFKVYREDLGDGMYGPPTYTIRKGEKLFNFIAVDDISTRILSTFKFISTPNQTPEPTPSPTPTPTGDATGQHCGGFIKNPPQCPTGYQCVLNKIADLGGTCQKI